MARKSHQEHSYSRSKRSKPKKNQLDPQTLERLLGSSATSSPTLPAEQAAALSKLLSAVLMGRMYGKQDAGRIQPDQGKRSETLAALHSHDTRLRFTNQVRSITHCHAELRVAEGVEMRKLARWSGRAVALSWIIESDLLDRPIYIALHGDTAVFLKNAPQAIEWTD